jgi:hypothetical protein
VEMEIEVDIDEGTLSLIKSHTGKDMASIISEALLKWANENILACPLDRAFCSSKESCNNCQKAKSML